MTTIGLSKAASLVQCTPDSIGALTSHTHKQIPGLYGLNISRMSQHSLEKCISCKSAPNFKDTRLSQNINKLSKMHLQITMREKNYFDKLCKIMRGACKIRIKRRDCGLQCFSYKWLELFEAVGTLPVEHFPVQMCAADTFPLN